MLKLQMATVSLLQPNDHEYETRALTAKYKCGECSTCHELVTALWEKRAFPQNMAISKFDAPRCNTCRQTTLEQPLRPGPMSTEAFATWLASRWPEESVKSPYVNGPLGPTQTQKNNKAFRKVAVHPKTICCSMLFYSFTHSRITAKPSGKALG